MKRNDFLHRIFVYGKNHIQIPVPVLPALFRVTFIPLGKRTSAGIGCRPDEIRTPAFRIEVTIIFPTIIFYFQHVNCVVIYGISEHHDGPVHERICLCRIILHMKPQLFRFFQDIFNRLLLSVQIIVYPGKQLHIVLILTSDERTGFLTALAQDFLHREYIADLFHQIDPQG